MPPDISTYMPEHIRNVVILAHVDHGLFYYFYYLGKTSIVDSLLAHQGLISQFQAGQIRYLDFLPEEQTRGITMKSASVALVYVPVPSRLYPKDKCQFLNYDRFLDKNKVLPTGDGACKIAEDTASITTEEPVLVHLIDTPGHVDFYGQVYCSSKLADGAIIVIDVVEGICAQTMAAFYLAFDLKLVPVLFLNKIDRLILELRFSATEIYDHLEKLTQSVNASCSMFRTCSKSGNTNMNVSHENVDAEEYDIFYFDPRKGNVLFGSAIDGWAFRLNLYANLYSKRPPFLPKAKLNATLWGKYYYSSKNKEILSITAGEEIPLFSSLIMRNIYSIYQAFLFEDEIDMERAQKICDSFSLSVNLKQCKDKRSLVRMVMKSWIPLSLTVFDSIIDSLPPASGKKPHNSDRIFAFLAKPIIYPELTETILKPYVLSQRKKKGIVCSINPPESHSHPNTSIDLRLSSQNPAGQIVMMGRLYSGHITNTSVLYFSSPNALEYNGSKLKEDFSLKLNDKFSLYQLMGSKLVKVSSVSEGNIFGISNILGASSIDIFFKNGFLSGFTDQKSSLLDLPCNLAEPLQNISFISSLPSGSFASTSIIGDPLISVSVEPAASLKNLHILQYAMLVLYEIDPSISVQFTDMGELLLKCCGELHLEQSLDELEKLVDFPIKVSPPIVPLGETISSSQPLPEMFTESFFKLNSQYFRDFIDDISFSFSNSICTFQTTVTNAGSICLSCSLDKAGSFSTNLHPHPISALELKSFLEFSKIEPNCHTGLLESAFSVAIANGPLCGEKIHSTKFIIHNFLLEIDSPDVVDTNIFLSPIKRMLHFAFLLWNATLMQGYNQVIINITGEWLGRVYALICKAGGDIVVGSEFDSERQLFQITTHIPVKETATFIDELRSKTAGVAFVNVSYFGLKELSGSPYREQGDERDGLKSMQQLLIQETRLRKGLYVDSKIIANAEKQRTLRRC